MRKLLASLLLLVGLAAAAAQTTNIEIPAPQQAPSGLVNTGWDANGVASWGAVNYTDINFYGLTGAQSTSTSENSVDYGTKTFVLDNGAGFAENYTVEIRTPQETVNYMYGEISAIDTSSGVTIITVAISKAKGGGIFDLFSIQVVGGPRFGLPATQAASIDTTDTFDVPAVGSTLNLTTQTGKAYTNNSVIYGVASTDYTSYFIASVISYNSSTGAISLLVTQSGGTGTGINPWSLSMISPQGADAALLAYSSTSNSIASGSLTFTTQSGKFFPVTSSVLLTDITNPTNKLFGKITAYSGTTLTIVVPAGGVYGSGSSSSWSIQLIDAPPVYGSPQTASITQVASASSSNSATITVPNTVLAGDLIVLVDTSESFAGFAQVLPSGYTQISYNKVADAAQSTTGQILVSYKLATAADAGAIVTGMTPGNGNKIMSVFRTDIPSTVLTVGSIVNSSAANAAPSNKTITSSGAATPVAVVGVFWSSYSTVNDITHAMSPAADGEFKNVGTGLGGNGPGATYIDWKLYNSAPADNTLSMSSTINVQVITGFYVTMKTLGFTVGDVVTFADDGSGNPQYPVIKLGNGITATRQGAGNNSTKVATTSYVDSFVSLTSGTFPTSSASQTVSSITGNTVAITWSAAKCTTTTRAFQIQLNGSTTAGDYGAWNLATAAVTSTASILSSAVPQTNAQTDTGYCIIRDAQTSNPTYDCYEKPASSATYTQFVHGVFNAPVSSVVYNWSSGSNFAASSPGTYAVSQK